MLLLDSGLIQELKKEGLTTINKTIKINIEKYEKYLNRKIQFHNIDNQNKHLLENIKQGILLYGVMP